MVYLRGDRRSRFRSSVIQRLSRVRVLVTNWPAVISSDLLIELNQQ